VRPLGRELEIREGGLENPVVQAFLSEHLEDMAGHSPPESKHALYLSGLLNPEITFWCVWDGNQLLGTEALKKLDSHHGEIKSIEDSTCARRQGGCQPNARSPTGRGPQTRSQESKLGDRFDGRLSSPPEDSMRSLVSRSADSSRSTSRIQTASSRGKDL